MLSASIRLNSHVERCLPKNVKIVFDRFRKWQDESLALGRVLEGRTVTLKNVTGLLEDADEMYKFLEDEFAFFGYGIDVSTFDASSRKKEHAMNMQITVMNLNEEETPNEKDADGETEPKLKFVQEDAILSRSTYNKLLEETVTTMVLSKLNDDNLLDKMPFSFEIDLTREPMKNYDTSLIEEGYKNVCASMLKWFNDTTSFDVSIQTDRREKDFTVSMTFYYNSPEWHSEELDTLNCWLFLSLRTVKRRPTILDGCEDKTTRAVDWTMLPDVVFPRILSYVIDGSFTIKQNY